MECQRCGAQMVIGIAIKPRNHDIRGGILCCNDALITADELELIEVWKCPICGDSRVD